MRFAATGFMSPGKKNDDEEAYGTPAYSALDGGGSGFTRVLYGDSAREVEESRQGALAASESDRLAQLRARMAEDSSLGASQVQVAFKNAALHLSGTMDDEKAWFALMNVAGTFAATVVDEIEGKARVP